MANSIKSIVLEKLIAHPDNPNRMSRANFTKLVRNIKKTGRYEPLVVRPLAKKRGCFEIINGHHRCRALGELDYEQADCVVWDVDDEQADILLSTLNRLGGSDELDRKLALLRRLNKKMKAAELAKFLPQTTKQIERLVSLQRPGLVAVGSVRGARCFANPMVFFLDDTQQQIIKNAIGLADAPKGKMTKAARNAAALTFIAQRFLKDSGSERGG